MVTIKKLRVDTNTDNLVISAESNCKGTYQFTKVYIDSIKTFNCKNEQSTLATEIDIKNGTQPYDLNTNLTDYKIPFNDIICVENPSTDILFVWILCKEGKDSPVYAYNSLRYMTDGADNYYYYDGGNTITVSTESDYNTAKENGTANGFAYLYSTTETSMMYFKVWDGTKYLYRKFDTESVASGTTVSTESEYENHVYGEFSSVGFGVTLSVKDFYELLLNHIDIETDDNNCKVDCSDVNFMLGWQGFNLAKTLQDYNQMIYYWNILHSQGSKSSSGCGCNK